jgi:steroid delta-isomerase-like uncharacterized protein
MEGGLNMSVGENKDFIRKYFSWDAVQVVREAGSKKLDLHTPDFMAHSSMGEMNLEQYGQGLQMLSAAFPDWKQTIDDMVAEGDKVSVRSTFTGTHKGTYMGLPPSGKKISMKTVSIYRIKDGKLAETWGVSDMLGLMQQLGAIPAGPAKKS